MKEKLHPFQLAILVYMIQSGITLFSIPRLAAEAFGTNGWLGILLISVIATINILFIGLVNKWGKGQSIFTLLGRLFPKWILIPFYLSIAVIVSLLGLLVAIKYVLLLKMLFFQETPSMVFIVMFFILSYLMLKGNIYQIGKATVILFFFTIWTVLLLTAHIPEFSFVRMTPFIFQGEKDLFKGGMGIYTAFLGYELCLFLIPYVEKKFLKAIMIGNGFTTIIYVSVSIVSFGFFSFEYILKDLYPVITLIEYVQFPFIERVENLIFTLFSLKVLITIVMYLWTGKELVHNSLPRLKPTFIILVLLTAGFILSFYARIIRVVDEWLQSLSYMQTGIAFFLPLLLLLTIGILKLKKGRI